MQVMYRVYHVGHRGIFLHVFLLHAPQDAEPQLFVVRAFEQLL